MQSNTSALASSRVTYCLRSTRSVFGLEKKLSMAALSQQSPRRLSAVISDFIDQPTTRLGYRSKTTATYSQPSAVQT